MTDDSYLLENNEKKKVNWFGRLLKISFILAAFFLVIITVLANMGGSSDTLKDAVTQFVSESFSGRPAEVDKLVNMSFFPSVGLDVEGIHVLTKPEDGIKIMSVGKLQAYMDFWHVATRKARLKAFYLEDVSAIKGAFLPNEIYIEKVFIDHDIENGIAHLKGNGKVGVHPWTLSAGMQVYGSKGKYEYTLGSSFPISLEIADVKLETNFINHEDNYFKLEAFSLIQGNKKIAGDILLSALGTDLVKIKTNIDIQNGSSVISADLVSNMKGRIDKYSGTIQSEKMVITDILGAESAFSIFKRVRDIFGYTERYQEENPMSILGPHNLDLNLDLKNMVLETNQTINVSVPLKLEKGHLKLADILAIPLEKDIITITSKTDGQDLSFLHQWLPVVPKTKIVDECRIERNGQEIQNLTLEKFSYDFVQASLQKTSEVSPCSKNIVKKVEAKKETEEVAEEVAEENAKQPAE